LYVCFFVIDGTASFLHLEAIRDDNAAEDGDDAFGDDVAVVGAIHILDAARVGDADVCANNSIRIDDAVT
jgi:hypothetical protein